MNNRTKVQPTSDALNKLVLSSINSAEKILLQLAENGELVEPTRIVSKESSSNSRMQLNEKCTCPHQSTVTMSHAQSVLVTSTENLPPVSSRSSYLDYAKKIRKNASQNSTCSTKAKIIHSSLTIKETPNNGINLEVDVLVFKDHIAPKRLQLSILCPNYQPNRICFDGEWREIVPSKKSALSLQQP